MASILEAGSLRGAASRRRPSMDWPLSREEKKRQAMVLYERDVLTCNELLECKDKALRAAKDEIKALRRASTGSTCTTTAGACSSPDELDAEFDDNDQASPERRETDEDATENATSSPQQSVNEQHELHGDESSADTKPQPEVSDCGIDLDRPSRHPTMQRSGSLEVFSNLWGPTRKTKPAELHGAKAQSNVKSQQRRSDDRTASPRRHPTMRRSSSLEAASSWWAPAWNAVRTGARRATETATETARIIADEARLVADEVREVLAVESRSEDLASGTAASNVNSAKSGVPTAEYIEWFVDLDSDAGDIGLSLEPSIHGEPQRVLRVTQGLALDAWNSSKVPVTVFLLPGRREAVMRRHMIRPGDELIAIDGEPLEQMKDSLMAVLEEAEHTAQRIQKCKTLTFRRKLPQRRDSVKASA